MTLSKEDRKAIQQANTGLSINPDQKKVVWYVDKPVFYQALVDYKEACRVATEAGEEIPRVPEYIGACFIKIANGLASKHNFQNYSFRDEMVGEAVETCLRYVKSFKPEKGNQPFAYFTQCCWYVFIGKISQEKKQSKIKRALIRYADFDTYSLQAQDEGGEYALNLQEFLSSLGPDDEDVKEEPKPPTVGKLEGFYE